MLLTTKNAHQIHGQTAHLSLKQLDDLATFLPSLLARD